MEDRNKPGGGRPGGGVCTINPPPGPTSLKMLSLHPPPPQDGLLTRNRFFGTEGCQWNGEILKKEKKENAKSRSLSPFWIRSRGHMSEGRTVGWIRTAIPPLICEGARLVNLRQGSLEQRDNYIRDPSRYKYVSYDLTGYPEVGQRLDRHMMESGYLRSISEGVTQNYTHTHTHICMHTRARERK